MGGRRGGWGGGGEGGGLEGYSHESWSRRMGNASLCHRPVVGMIRMLPGAAGGGAPASTGGAAAAAPPKQMFSFHSEYVVQLPDSAVQEAVTLLGFRAMKVNRQWLARRGVRLFRVFGEDGALVCAGFYECGCSAGGLGGEVAERFVNLVYFGARADAQRGAGSYGLERWLGSYRGSTIITVYIPAEYEIVSCRTLRKFPEGWGSGGSAREASRILSDAGATRGLFLSAPKVVLMRAYSSVLKPTLVWGGWDMLRSLDHGGYIRVSSFEEYVFKFSQNAEIMVRKRRSTRSLSTNKSSE